MLKETHEGWYVEYKSEFMKERELAKSLSSFANQFGGWIFFGVTNDSNSLLPKQFLGIGESNLSQGLQRLRNASKDLLNPSVHYDYKVFQGPIESLGLGSDRSIVAVYIPEGADTPYVHNNGRIYSRIGDSSQPHAIHDRSSFDMLSRRGVEARRRLNDLVEKEFTTSRGEEQACYIHFIATTDPYERMGHVFQGQFDDFVGIMREAAIPFDNFYSSPNGYVARQTAHNDYYNRLLTWHHFNRCHSFITLPLPTLDASSEIGWTYYNTGHRFRQQLMAKDLEYAKILDLNVVPSISLAIARRYRELLNISYSPGPIYIKVRIENAWRAVPFIDMEQYLSHIGRVGIPINQEENMLVLDGTSLDSFFVLPGVDEQAPGGASRSDVATIAVAVQVLNAFGIPREFSLKYTADLLELGTRRMEYQRRLREPN